MRAAYLDDPVMRRHAAPPAPAGAFFPNFDDGIEDWELPITGDGSADVVVVDTSDRQTVDASPVVTTNASETSILNVPWGPNVDILFDPQNIASFAGGKVVLYAQCRGIRAKLSSVTITDITKPLWLTGGAGCENYVVTAQLGSAAAVPQPACRVVGTSYSGRQGGNAGLNPKLLTLVAGNQTTQAGSVAKQIMGRVYFDPTKYNPNDVVFRVLLATSDVSEPAFVDLFDEQGITNGGTPIAIPGSQMSTTSLTSVVKVIDLQALAAATSAGSLAVRMWLNPATGGTATLSEAQLEVT